MKSAKVNSENRVDVLKAWEANPFDGALLEQAACIVAFACIKKASDPQASRAGEREDAITPEGYHKVSDSACAPIYREMRRDIMEVTTLKRNAGEGGKTFERVTLRNGQTTFAQDENGLIETVYSESEVNALDALASVTFGDGFDIVQDASLALWEAFTMYGENGGHWLENAVFVSKPRKRVLSALEKPEMVDVESLPIIEVYQHTRQYIRKMGSVKTEPTSGFLYWQDLEEAEKDIYHRGGRFADIGGSVASGNKSHFLDFSQGQDVITADALEAMEYYSIIERMNLTEREHAILRGRERGESVRAIAARLNTSNGSVSKSIKRMQVKFVEAVKQ